MPSTIRKKTSSATAARKLQARTIADKLVISSDLPPPPPPVEFRLLPSREEQTSDRLRPEAEQWMNQLRHAEGMSGQNPDESLLMHLARSNFYNAVRLGEMDPATAALASKYTSTTSRGGDGLGDSTPIRAILSMLSSHLEEDANAAAKVQEARLQLHSPQPQHDKYDSMSTIGQARTKYATPSDGPLANYRRNMPLLSQRDEERAFDEFYADDQFDATRPFGIDADPSSFPMLLEVTAKYARHIESVQNGAYDRHISDIPLPEMPDPIPRAYILNYRYPPGPRDTRLCITGDKCLFNNARWGSHGYIGREFRLPDQPSPEPGEPVGFCIDCMLYYIYLVYDRNVKNGTIPTEPIHKFTVIKGRVGEYADNCMLPIDKPGNQITGIVGPVPFYSMGQRAMQPTPWPIVRQLKLSTTSASGGRPNYLAEVNMDFHHASAASTVASFPTF